MARVYVVEIYRATRSFPRDELFGLTSQLRRAAVSVANNIAEGSDRKSDVEFTRYLRMAITSVNEVVTDLYIALDQQYIDRQTFTTLYERANELAAKLNALIGTLTKSTARLR